MSTYDILMLAVFGGAILFGAWKGLAWQVASLAAVFVSYFVALTFREPLAAQISVDPPLNKFIAMLALFLGTSLVIWMIFGRIRSQIKKMNMGGFDRQAGALVGAFKGALLCMVVTLFATTLLGDGVRQSIVSSRSGGYIARGINQLNSVVPQELHAILNPYVEKFNQNYVQQGQGSGTENGVTIPNQSQPVLGQNGSNPINGLGQNGLPTQQVNYGQQNSPSQQQPPYQGNPQNTPRYNPNANTGVTNRQTGNQQNQGSQIQNNNSYSNPNGTNQYGTLNRTSQTNQYEVRGQINRNTGSQSNQYQSQWQVNPTRNTNPPSNGYNSSYNSGYSNQRQNQNPNFQNPNNQNQGFPNTGMPNAQNQRQAYPPNQNQYQQRNDQGNNGVISQGANGWPEINVPINTKDIWETTKGAASEAAKRALENLNK